jgi:hypothetical protein
MPRLSRRGFLALGGSGATAIALGACGSAAESHDEGDDVGLLADAVTAETGYGEAAKAAADQQGVSAEIEKASTARLGELGRAAGPGADPAGGGQTVTDLADAAAAAIAAYRQVARAGSTTELRSTGTQFVAQVAAELAAVRELASDNPVPYAFVTGLGEPPLEFPDDAPSGVDATTSTTTTSSSTTTEGG